MLELFLFFDHVVIQYELVVCVSQSHIETIFDCQFHPDDADVLATGSFDGTIKVWDISSLKPVNKRNSVECHHFVEA